MAIGICCLLFNISGCAKEETAENILEQYMNNWEKIESYEGAYEMSMKLGIQASDVSTDMEIKIDMDYEVISNPIAMHQEGDMEIKELGISMDMDSYLLEEDGKIVNYAKYNNEWMKAAYGEDNAITILNLDEMGENADSYKLENKTEKVNDKETYVLTATVKGEEMSDVLENLISEESLEGLDIDMDLSDIHMNYELNIYKETMLPARMAVMMESNDNSVLYSEEGIEITLEGFEYEMIVNAYDSVNKIEVPEEAKEENGTSSNIDTTNEETTSAREDIANEEMLNLDNMQIQINGKTYTLGKTTLQDMIDDGVPFDEDDIANADNNLNKNSESQGFKIELGEYWSAQVSFFNDTDTNKKISECYISKVYLPVKQDQTENILTFSFPLTVTEDELRDSAGEPTEFDEYISDDKKYTSHTLEYKTDSSKYIRDWGYKFEYINNELEYVTLTWLP